MQYKTARKSLRHTGLLPVVNLDGALHRLAVMTDQSGALHIVDTLGWHEVSVDLNAKVWFTRRRAENAAMRLGLTAWVGRSAERLGLVVGQTFAEYASDDRFDSIGEKKGLTADEIVVLLLNGEQVVAA